MPQLSKTLDQLYRQLHQLLGLHRKLYELVREEKTHLIAANVEQIQLVVNSKEVIMSQIVQLEFERHHFISQQVQNFPEFGKATTLSEMMRQVQHLFPTQVENLQRVYQALRIFLERIIKLNEENRQLVARSLDHICAMKKNVLGADVQKSATYSVTGQKTPLPGGGPLGTPRLLAQEA